MLVGINKLGIRVTGWNVSRNQSLFLDRVISKARGRFFWENRQIEVSGRSLTAT